MEDFCNYRDIRERIECAIKFIDHLQPGMTDFLAAPKKSTLVNFPIEMDDGTVEVFHGYRVVHNPAKRKQV